VRTLFTIATACAIIAIVGEILLPDHLMICLLAAISVLVVNVAWWLLRREHRAAKEAGIEAAFEAITRYQCPARHDGWHA
jgi:H+/Cl- antiporter ClcA